MLTEDQVLSLLRSRASGANLGFVSIRRIDPSTDSNRIAQQSLDEARSEHIVLYGNGILVNLMRAGGFVVLAFDTKSNAATKLDLVAPEEAGQANVKSEIVDGELSKSAALEIINKSERLSKVFFNAPDSNLSEVLRDFGGTRGANVAALDGQGYLAIPEAVIKLAASSDELLELISLTSGLQLWSVRHALSFPLYAANPAAAVEKARNEQSRLQKEFLEKNGEHIDFVNHLVDLNSIETHDQLLERIQRLRELSNFLNERFPVRLDSSTHKANVSIAVICLNLGVTKQNSERMYATMNAAGMISIWGRAENGDFTLRGLSEGD